MIPGKGYKCMRDEGWLFGLSFSLLGKYYRDKWIENKRL